MAKAFISSAADPAAIGIYSQAVAANGVLYISGQIPLVPETMTLVSEDISEQIHQVFQNLDGICQAAGTTLNQAIKFNIYLTDLAHFAKVNTYMESLLNAPYPARAVVEVSALPKSAQIEIDAIIDLT